MWISMNSTIIILMSFLIRLNCAICKSISLLCNIYKLLLIKHGVSQGSFLQPLLFLQYNNDLQKAITFSKIHHFADDTNFLHDSPFLKDNKRKTNYDTSRVTHWWVNRISLNVAKTEIILFRSDKTKITKKWNFWISSQKIKIITQTKYLGVILDDHLNFKKEIDTAKQKLTRSTSLLANLRNYVDKKVLKSIYYAIYDSNMRYNSQIWGQNFNTLLREI